MDAHEIATTGAERRARLRHHGEAFDLFGIFIANVALTIVTLGVYRFWAKTRIRRFLWSETEFLDDRLEYTGTGGELFVGFLIVLAFLAAVLAAYSAIFTGIWPEWMNSEELTVLYNLPLFVASVPLVGVARFRARRYRLSRTLWRGIRGTQTGSSVQYGLRETAFWLLTFVTLGFYWPYMSTRLVGYQLNHTWFGDRRVAFDGVGDALIGRFAVCWLLTLPTLGMCWFWYRAASLRYFASRMRFAEIRFEVTVQGRSLMMLVSSNLLLTWFTMGLAYPYVLLRVANFVCDNVTLVGEQDFAHIAQSLKPVPTTGEGLAEAFDVGDF